MLYENEVFYVSGKDAPPININRCCTKTNELGWLPATKFEININRCCTKTLEDDNQWHSYAR